MFYFAVLELVWFFFHSSLSAQFSHLLMPYEHIFLYILDLLWMLYFVCLELSLWVLNEMGNGNK